MTTQPRLIEVMAPYARIPEHLGPADFRPCSGKVCADSAFYAPLFAELVWRALRTVVVMPARTRADPVPEGCLPAAKPSLPLLVRDGDKDNIFEVRRGAGARGERGSGKGGCLSTSSAARGTSMMVRDLSEWMRDDAYSEVACRTRVCDFGCEVRRRPSLNGSSGRAQHIRGTTFGRDPAGQFTRSSTGSRTLRPR